jgi:hypothetical protein
MAGIGISPSRWLPTPSFAASARIARPQKGGAETNGHGQPASLQARARALVDLTVAEVRRLLRD